MSNPEFIVAVPARFSASRLPGKPLRLLGGEPIVRHVVRRALAAGAVEVVLATDDDRIADAAGHALYFSRAPIPWHRDRYVADRITVPAAPCLRHIGLYAYRAGFLRVFQSLPPGRLEQLEALEQLRVLEAGHRIAVALSPAPFPQGIDTEDDLLRAEVALRDA